MFILYFFLFILLIIIFLVLSIGMSILKIFFKRPGRNKSHNTHGRQGNASSGSSSEHRQGKVFGKDEGEYVDYEEIE